MRGRDSEREESALSTKDNGDGKRFLVFAFVCAEEILKDKRLGFRV